MIHYVVAFALLLHVIFWGAGLAMLAMPHRWRRFWPVLVMPAGWALQSAVVWAGAHCGLRGTDSYAWWSEGVPLALLVFAFWRNVSGRSSDDRMRDTFRTAWADIGRFGVVWATVAGCLVLLVLPLAIASKGLTTISLGSCDAADYAAGARVLQEFARGDRAGFIGLTEVVRIGSVDNFFDYWLRLNHFTPAALIALNGTVLDSPPDQLTSIFTAVLLAGTLPLVFWSARGIFEYSGGVSIIVAALFGVSPIMWYAFAHVSPGQLLAAQAVVLLTWSGVSLWRDGASARTGVRFMPMLAIGYWLILGSYNFFLLLCLVPAVTYAGGWAIVKRAGRRFVLWLGLMLAPMLGCALVFSGRIVGIAERFSLLQTYDFGWKIPALTAEGWLGMVGRTDLTAWDFFGLRWVLSAGVIGLWGWAFLRAIQQRRTAAWTVVAVLMPILAGYFFLEARGARLGTNASYDAYKLFAVFYPLLLPAFCWWVTLRRSRKLHEWFLVAGVACVIGAFNLIACGLFVWNLSRPPLLVDSALRQLRRVEEMADIKSVNLLIPDMWSRLWANAFLLRKEQFFETHTYEARRNTELRGEWDLEGGIVRVALPAPARREVSPRFALLDTRHPAFVRASLGDGWHPEESVAGSDERWAWTSGEATLRFDNPHEYPLAIHCSIDGWSAVERTVALVRAGGEARPVVASRADKAMLEVSVGTAGIGRPVALVREKRGPVPLRALGVPPGPSILVLQHPQPAVQVPGDPRSLGVAVFRFTIRPQQ